MLLHGSTRVNHTPTALTQVDIAIMTVGHSNRFDLLLRLAFFLLFTILTKNLMRKFHIPRYCELVEVMSNVLMTEWTKK
jgi:hypothetical protein